MKPITSSAECKASPDVACERILSEAGLHAWWIGKVNVTLRDPGWPALNTRMTWRMRKKWVFAARITEDSRPHRVVMEVITPSADSTVTNTFEALPAGGTRYTKTVVPKPRSFFGRLMLPLFGSIIRASVKKEVTRAVKFADG